MTKTVQELKVGDVIMPPAREVRLWMRRELVQRGLPESALYLTIVDIYEGAPDKGGRWLVIKGNQTPEWNANLVSAPSLFKFKARPETPWQTA